MFYKITVSNERSASDVYIASTKEECEKHIMEFADFYCDNGTCSIYEIDNRFVTHRYWRYESGKCVEESSREAEIEKMGISHNIFSDEWGRIIEEIEEKLVCIKQR